MNLSKQIYKWRISQSEIRNSAAEKNWKRKARAGKNSFPDPLPFCPPERLDFKIRNLDFVQNKFELHSENTASYFEYRATDLPSIYRYSKNQKTGPEIRIRTNGHDPATFFIG